MAKNHLLEFSPDFISWEYSSLVFLDQMTSIGSVKE